jgi:hypothetical protein
MDETKFKIGELVLYPSYDGPGDEIELHVGLVVDTFEEKDHGLDERIFDMKQVTMYKVVGEWTDSHTEGLYYSWEILKFDSVAK